MFNAKKRTFFLTSLSGLTLVAIMTVTIGCQWETPETVTTCSPTVTTVSLGEKPELEIKLAPIHDVQINITESSPRQVFVYIKGGLADSCTTFHGLEIERLDLPMKIHYGGDTIRITVTTQRPKDSVCTQVYSFFEKNVALGSDFIVTELYLVDVNGIATDFFYP